MCDDVTDIADFYNNDPVREHERLAQHQLEYDLTWRYSKQYLPSKGSILEVGAATGRYTLALAKHGYKLTAVDLSAALIEECRKNVVAEGLGERVHLLVADARDLKGVVEKDFDAVLLMGPLYHLIEEADRMLALTEAFKRLQNGGIIVSAFISRFGTLSQLIKTNPSWIEDETHVRSMLRRGKRSDELPRGGFRGYLAHVSELAPLHQRVGFETLSVAGIEPVIAAEDESYNKLYGEQRRLWLELLYKISTESSIIGASRPLLYIGKKPAAGK